jgi:acetyl esterase/lipase
MLASIAILAPAVSLADQRQSPPSPETVDYGPARLDIYAPAGASNLPVVFFVHGGAWRFGRRSQVGSKPDFLLANGFVFVSIDYRMLPEADVATQASDVEKAYAYVRANIARHGGDPNRIVGMGHSAGCHLIALTGMRGDLPGIAGLILDDTRAYDLAALSRNGGMVRAYARVFSDPTQWAALSPATYVDGKKHPPTFIAYSRAPGRGEESKAFAERLRATGTKVTLFDGSAYTHMSINGDFGKDGDALTAAALAFLRATIA